MEFSPPRKRKRTSANSPFAGPASAFAAVQRRRNSSSSSDILVAPAPATSSSPRTGSAVDEEKAMATSSASMNGRLPWLGVRVEGGRRLVVEFKNRAAKLELEKILNGTAPALPFDVPALVSDDEGPNARGTYSKAYVARHPEIEWVHRGQGRYLPASKAKAAATAPLASERTPRTRESRQSSSRMHLVKEEDAMAPSPFVQQSSGRRRGIHKDLRDFNRSPERPPKPPGRLSLRSMRSFEEDPVRSPLVTRSGRNAKLEPEADSPERRPSRFPSRRTYAEQDSAGTDDDMAGDREQTFDRDYVDAHPDEDFYHTGNGWYKRGLRPKGHKAPRKRESAGHATARLSEGSFNFDANQTIHSTQLAFYPNIEFHHCGNGWYKPGPDATGHRNSTIVEQSPPESPESQDTAEDDEAMDDNILSATVSRQYKEQHPEIEWVHRGNGRYRAVNLRPPAQKVNSPQQDDEEDEAERDTRTYSRAYVDAHPGELFHHRGNARYMRGPPPQRWADAREKRRQSSVPEATPAATPVVEDGQLYDRAYVEAHPGEVFHHRGQGRYARGPRQPRVSAPQSVVDEPEEESDIDPEELVDTDYVQSHQHETFHHRGQGRWARGLPPIGASSKIAIRGPGASEEFRLSASSSRAEGMGEMDGEEEDGAAEPPPVTALLQKHEGPAKFPHLSWVYRGGGKWAQVTKQQAEDMHKRKVGIKPKGRARKSRDGATAQLEREAAAADAHGYDVDDEEGFGESPGHMLPKSRAPAGRRRRLNNLTWGESFNMDDDMLLSKQSSQKSVSQAPTPKPRVMTEEEDVLDESDLPSLWRDEWSPITEDLDEADTLLRQRFRPMNGAEVFLKGMTKYDPNTRPTKNLVELAENADIALQELAAEYLELEKLTAPHRRVPGKPAKGGTVPIDPLAWEDRKEADLYDYHFDPRKVGEQDPDSQRIQRDAEGRELRGRRNRSAFHNTGTVPGWNFGEDQPLGPRRAVKAPQRFDGVVAPPRKRARNSTTATRGTSQAPSLTPERGMTPLAEPATLPIVHAKGRWAGHVPKRVQELRGESVAASVGPAGGRASKEGSPARKGRPPGSKNLHKRKDAGIKKGPRKPKVQSPVAPPTEGAEAATPSPGTASAAGGEVGGAQVGIGGW